MSAHLPGITLADATLWHLSSDHSWIWLPTNFVSEYTLSRVSFFYCWRKPHSKIRFVDNSLQPGNWKGEVETFAVMSKDKESGGFWYTSQTDGSDHFLFNDSRHWHGLPPSWVEKGILSRRFGQRKWQQYWILWQHIPICFWSIHTSLPFHSSALTPLKSCFQKDF